MNYKLIKIINEFFESTRYTDKYIFYVDKKYNAKCLDRNTLECIWMYENVYNGFVNNDLLVIELKNSKVLLYSLIERKIVQITEGKLNSSPGKFGLNYYYGNIGKIDDEHFSIVQYHLKSNQIRIQITKYAIVLLIDDFTYLSLIHNKNDKWSYNVISKINFCNDSVFWKYSISDLGPYLEFRSPLEPLEWVERKIYDLYLENGIIFAIISKGIVALDPETGKQLWWVDFNTTEMETVFFDFQPYSLSFADGKIYGRDWHEFLSISMATGEILLRKEYIGFEVSGKVVENTKNSGLKIHNGKGYFVLDVDAELYLVSMNLETAEVKIETELPDVKDQVHAEDIYFEGNRMYLRDCASFLYVYEVTD